MSSTQPVALPDHSLLKKYGQDGGYADCYVTRFPGSVSQANYVEAFYTSGLFRIERTMLGVFAGRPATDQDAVALATGNSSVFSAWNVEARTLEQLLLRDYTGHTRSWLMATASPDGKHTDLYFGSAVIARISSGSSRPRMGFVFHALLGFHRVYSRLLLRAAAASCRHVSHD